MIKTTGFSTSVTATAKNSLEWIVVGTINISYILRQVNYKIVIIV